MPDDAPRWKPYESARKWHALEKRRRDALVELYRSGRWRRYFTEEAFVARMREAVKSVEAWAALIDKLSHAQTPVAACAEAPRSSAPPLAAAGR